jgi:hypothetical protein
MLIVAIIPFPRNPDSLIYHFPLNEKVNADALPVSLPFLKAVICINIKNNKGAPRLVQPLGLMRLCIQGIDTRGPGAASKMAADGGLFLVFWGPYVSRLK